jgi:hypothetical protein
MHWQNYKKNSLVVQQREFYFKENLKDVLLIQRQEFLL